MAAKPKGSKSKATNRTKDGRFLPGESGNTNGRPRKGASTMGTALEKVLKEPVTIIEKGRRRRITKKDAIAMQLVTKAAQGDARAAQHLLSAIRHYEQRSETPGPAASWAFVEDDQKVIAQVIERILRSAALEPDQVVEATVQNAPKESQ